MRILTTIDESITEVTRLRAVLKKHLSAQVRSIDERSLIKATAQSWFTSHRPVVVALLNDEQLIATDETYKDLLALSERNTSREKYDSILKSLQKALASIRSDNIVTLSKPIVPKSGSEKMPDFSILVSDTEMQAILSRRWNECAICVASKAPLAATVMLGGLLEALLLARINQLSDKSRVFTAKSSPKDRKTGNPLPLQDWGLRDYIDVAHELGWISQTEKDLGNVLRDYRNYIHPYKERSHGIILEPKDAEILWQLGKNISRQLLGAIPLH